MAPIQKRRKSDYNISAHVPTMVKATLSFLIFGGLSFLGSWGIDVSKSLAQLKEEVAVVKDQNHMIGPWMIDEVKKIRSDIQDIRREVILDQKILKDQIQQVALEQMRRKAIIEKMEAR